MNIKQKYIGHQKGMTIISLMVGLFISMLCILASLTLYKNLVRVAASAKVDAAHDGQLSIAMLTLQKYILSAGYGIDNAGASDIVVKEVAAAGTPIVPGTIELLWRYLNNGTYVCMGLRESNEARGTRNYRTLALRTAATNCTATADLKTLATWADVATIAEWPVIGGLATYIAANETLLSFSIASTSCSPFGSGDSEAHLSLQVSAPNSASLNGGTTITSTDYQYCLPNTYPAAI